MLNLELERIEVSQKLELRYRVQALPDQTPTGGGAALVEVKTVNDLPVIKNSNEVRFK